MKGKVIVRLTSMFNKKFSRNYHDQNLKKSDKELLCTKRFLLMGVPCFFVDVVMVNFHMVLPFWYYGKSHCTDIGNTLITYP
jgi:hypothetical protein